MAYIEISLLVILGLIGIILFNVLIISIYRFINDSIKYIKQEKNDNNKKLIGDRGKNYKNILPPKIPR